MSLAHHPLSCVGDRQRRWRSANAVAGRRFNERWLPLAMSLGLLQSLAMLSTAVPSASAAGNVLVLPANGKPTPAGLMLSVDTDWAEGHGYRPVKLTATCTPTATFDRTLSVTLITHGWGFDRKITSVSTDIEIPAGTPSVSETLLVPDFSTWQYYSLVTAEDGREIEALSTNFQQTATGGQFDGQLVSLVIAAKEPDSSALYNMFTGSAGNSPSNSVSRTLGDLPDEWLAYSGLDLISLSIDDARQLAATQPKVWSAIRDWTAAGGNLCVHGIGDDWEHLAALDRVLDDRSISPDAGDLKTHGWAEADKALFGRQPSVPGQGVDVYESIDGVTTFVNEPDVATTVPDKPLPPRVPPEKSPFLVRAFSLGRVVALATNQPFPPAQDEAYADAHIQASLNWHWVLTQLGAPRADWPTRLGVSPTEENFDFWNFLVEGVGLPPVDTYRVLITVFVLLIGPLNYLLLRRWRRLHLLLFTTPACAIAVTLLLLGYALAADGLAIRMRARSFSVLDQRAGREVAWARLSYYAGLTPSGGMTFPRDALLIPYDFEPNVYATGRSTRAVEWDKQQRLTRGWLPARTPTQYLLVRSGPATRRLIVAAVDKGRLSVRNELGTPLDKLLVRDDAGRLFYGESIGPGATALVEPVTGGFMADSMGPEVEQFQQAMMRAQPQDPSNLTIDERRSFFGPRSRSYYGGKTRGGVGQASGQMESNIRHWQNAVVGPNAGLETRSFLAISEHLQAAMTGVDDTQQTGGFHLVHGSW